MTENIKLFDGYSAYIFNQLYQNFPKCINFEPIKEIQNTHDNTEFSEEEKGVIFSETILWLEENELLKIKTKIPHSQRPVEPILFHQFLCVRLTIKGLNLLTSPKPKSIDKKQKLGEEIIQKVKQGLFVEAGKLVTEAMFEFTKGKL
jgi:hypothetical protein